ncbi:MAG TPA: hypothetical protein VFZ70_09665 [Euzebyales bacterium]
MGAGVRDRTTYGGATVVGAAIIALLLLVGVLPARAAEEAQVPPVDPYASYEPQGTCDPTPKPGVVAFAKLLLEAYPVSGWSGISRECGVRGTSEHKEGRAFDWSVSVANPQQRAAAEDALAKLLATDDEGNRHALFRRFGLMYMIWDRQIFSASQADAGWRPYACNSAASYDSCHVNHVHFSFSTAGAQMLTSWWRMRPDPQDAPAIERVMAPTRATMAIKFSRSAFPTRGSADSVFLAATDAPEDAMLASVMAGAAHGSVLLTRGGSQLERRVNGELSRVLSAGGSITLVGDQASLPDELVRERAGSHEIRRVAGRDALTTARVAGLEMERAGRSRTAVLAGLDALDEALPMVAVAAANDWPLIFTATDELSAEARGFLRETDIARVHIAGSTEAVSDAVQQQVAQLSGVAVERHAGGTPSRVSVAVAEHFFAIPSAYALVNRDEIATASVAAAYAGERRHAPVLLTNGRGVDGEVVDYMISSASPDTGGILVGDTQTVGREIERQLRRVLGN